MDEQYEQMQYFAQALNQFNDRIFWSVHDLAAQHTQVDPLWQDSFRRDYDREWQTFQTAMIRYINNEGPAYAQFLHDKLIALRRFLYGD